MVEKFSNTIIVLMLTFILVILFILGIPLVQGNSIYAVLTESMEPNYPVGSLVVVEPVDPADVQRNDVITFEAGGGFRDLATHRVISVDEENKRFITKGDNNSNIDFAPIPYERVQGRVDYSIPLLGVIVTYIKTPKGIMASAGILLFMVLLFVLPSFFEEEDEDDQAVENIDD